MKTPKPKPIATIRLLAMDTLPRLLPERTAADLAALKARLVDLVETCQAHFLEVTGLTINTMQALLLIDREIELCEWPSAWERPI